MPHVNDSLKAMNDALSALQARVDLVLSSRAGMTAAEFEARIRAATQEAIDAVLAQLAGLDVSVIQVRQVFLRKVMGQINAYGPDRYLFEYFDDAFSVADKFTLSGVITTAGDNSMDVASTVGIEPGREYVVETPERAVTIRIRDILSVTRFRATTQLPYSMTDATLRRTNWTWGQNQATAKAGQTYYSKLLSLGDLNAHKALVIRREVSAAILRVFYREKDLTTWTEALWAWRRDHTYVLADFGLNTAGPAEGEEDFEYVLPVSGLFEVKIVCELPEGVDPATAVTVKHIVGLGAVSALGGATNPDNPIEDIPGAVGLPAASAADAGKVLTVSAEGKPVWGQTVQRLALIYG